MSDQHPCSQSIEASERWESGTTPTERYHEVQLLMSEYAMRGKPGMWESHPDDGEFVIVRWTMDREFFGGLGGNQVLVFAPDGTKKLGWAGHDGRLQSVGNSKTWKGKKAQPPAPAK
jgi:hypothetical protein